MRQTIFENKQKADELIQEAIRIWQGSDHPDQLEGLERDPVFSLLMTALAYQANELENELDNMKSDVVEEFSRLLTTYEVGHAIPATAVVQTALQSGIPEMELTDRHVFTLAESAASFMPLLRTRVLNTSLRSVVRLDGRRWKLSFQFDSPISDLSGFAFCIKNHFFKDLKVTFKGQPIPLVAPWDFSDLPLSPSFDIDSVLYNHSQTYMAAASCLDLFARQNVRMYCVKQFQGKKLIPAETDSLDLVFEFTGINDNFLFDKEKIFLNTIILVNAQMHVADLTSESPIVRVAGFGSQSTDPNNVSQQFLHMLRPSSDQIFGDIPVEVRKVDGDRFNQGSLVVLLNNLISKYYTDYYAFQNIQVEANDRVMHNLIDLLTQIRDSARADSERRIPGVYLMLRPQTDKQAKPVNLSVSYLTTQGSAVNSQLTPNSTFLPPTGFNSAATSQIAAPVLGSDEVRDKTEEAVLSRYYMVTTDRLVTPADMKLFCYTELQLRFGISRQMIKNISICHRQQLDRWNAGYEILVDIILNDSSYIRKGFEEKIPHAETLLQAMMSVRSVNIYPIQVTIQIDKQNK